MQTESMIIRMFFGTEKNGVQKPRGFPRRVSSCASGFRPANHHLMDERLEKHQRIDPI